jgi:hypothetical protein
VKYVAYDIGGANIKRLVAEGGEEVEVLSSDIFYFPLWKKKSDLGGFLRDIAVDANVKAVTMSAELCDCFTNKSEGVEYIVSVCDSVLDEPYYLTVDGVLMRSGELDNPSLLAAANFVASLFYLVDNFERGILLDVGSTTTDVVPFARDTRKYGRTDLERLLRRQLVYTGYLRTPLCAIVREVLYKGKKIGIASEVFAISADVYNILHNCEYTCETPDGKGKTKKDSMRRLARQLCADLEEVSETELKKICLQIRDAQLDMISEALREVSSTENLDIVYVCGAGREIAVMACEKAYLRAYDLSKLTSAHENLPCLGLVWMMHRL